MPALCGKVRRDLHELQRPGNVYSDGVPAEESQKTLRLLIVVVPALALGFYAV